MNWVKAVEAKEKQFNSADNIQQQSRRESDIKLGTSKCVQLKGYYGKFKHKFQGILHRKEDGVFLMAKINNIYFPRNSNDGEVTKSINLRVPFEKGLIGDDNEHRDGSVLSPCEPYHKRYFEVTSKARVLKLDAERCTAWNRIINQFYLKEIKHKHKLVNGPLPEYCYLMAIYQNNIGAVILKSESPSVYVLTTPSKLITSPEESKEETVAEMNELLKKYVQEWILRPKLPN